MFLISFEMFPIFYESLFEVSNRPSSRRLLIDLMMMDVRLLGMRRYDFSVLSGRVCN